MFIDRLINQTNAPLLERVVEFTAARSTLLAQNVANVSTPGYRQKDLSIDKFNEALRRTVERGRSNGNAVVAGDAELEEASPSNSILFHDGNNRSIEQLMTDVPKNALTHNIAIELLRRQFSDMENALRERVT